MTGKSCLHTSLKLSLAATIYWLWRDRNCILFERKRISVVDLFIWLEDEVRAFLCSRQKMSRYLMRIGFWQGINESYPTVSLVLRLESSSFFFFAKSFLG